MATKTIQFEEEWTIDSTIDLTKACVDAGWHRQTSIEALRALGLSRDDAEAYTDFLFTLAAKEADYEPTDHLTDTQWDRLL